MDNYNKNKDIVLGIHDVDKEFYTDVVILDNDKNLNYQLHNTEHKDHIDNNSDHRNINSSNHDHLKDYKESGSGMSKKDVDVSNVVQSLCQEKEFSNNVCEQNVLKRPSLSFLQNTNFVDDEEEPLNIRAKIESLLFATPKPLSISDLVSLIDEDIMPSQVQQIVDDIQNEYQQKKGGFKLVFIKGAGYQFRTAKGAQKVLTNLFASRPRPLSRPALETLAIIAYKQPITRSAIEYIRGTDCGSIIKNLLERNLIKCVGRKEIVGKPMLFGTTEEFLRVFQLKSLDELPSLLSFQSPSEIQNIADKDYDVEDADINTEKDLLGNVDDALISDGMLSKDTT